MAVAVYERKFDAVKCLVEECNANVNGEYVIIGLAVVPKHQYDVQYAIIGKSSQFRCV